MKKNEIYEGVVKELRFPNKGMVVVDQEPETSVMVKNTLPGQHIRFSLQKNKATKKEGRLMEILKPSPLSTCEPPCPHFEYCGGCAYEGLSYDAQKHLKLSQVQELLRKVMPDFPLYECISSPMEWNYRNKMEFSFGDECKDGPLTLGLHKRGSFYDIVPTEQCHIVNDDFCKVLSFTLSFFRERNASYVHKRTHEGFLRHLLIRRSETTKKLLVCLVTSSQDEGGVEEWAKGLSSVELEGSFGGILHMKNDSLADVVQADETRILYGTDTLTEELLGLQFEISPFSFFQTNTKGAEVLYQVVRDYIGDIDHRVVFDLYSGTGTIANILSPVASKVIGVEIVEEAVAAAKENAKRNGLGNCTFICGDVLKTLDEVEDKPDYIILDPPREGVHPKALKQIIQYGVNRLVYVSCKPTSLARDLEAFLEAGYVPEKSVCVDMFPFTRGIETVVLFVKND